MHIGDVIAHLYDHTYLIISMMLIFNLRITCMHADQHLSVFGSPGHAVVIISTDNQSMFADIVDQKGRPTAYVLTG